MDRLRTLAYASVPMLIVGGLLHVGKSMLVPVVLGAVVASLGEDAARPAAARGELTG